jgi:diguanylate cyclase (GGDEF)-like protein
LAKFTTSGAKRTVIGRGGNAPAKGDREKARDNETALTHLTEAEEHAREAAERDAAAKERDDAAKERDSAAGERDQVMAELEKSSVEGGSAPDWVVRYGRQLRRGAAADRAAAEADRRMAAEDRARAAADRADAMEILREAQLDDLTGAYRRSLGERMLEDEVERARRSGDGLVLAAMDVDGLKRVNDTQGHLAGDQLLRDSVASIRANIRSYEPIVRIGGDEFLFTISGVSRAEAEERTALIRADLARRPSGGRLTLGLAELEPEDDLSDLIGRADADLIEARRAPPEALQR